MSRCRHGVGGRAAWRDLRWRLCRVHQHVHRGGHADQHVLVQLRDEPVGVGATRVLLLVRVEPSAVEWLQRWQQQRELCAHVLVCRAATIATLAISTSTFTPPVPAHIATPAVATVFATCTSTLSTTTVTASEPAAV